MTYDAVVVGAGPAGSTCAYRLATRGASVLLLDRAGFPRDKPCGGGVTGRAARLLPFALDPVVEDAVSSVDLRLRYGKWHPRDGSGALVSMTQRLRLDAYLAEQAARAGAEFRDGIRVTEVELGDDGVVVRSNGELVRGRTLVGADGVNGIVGRSVGLGGNRTVGVALEGNVPYEGDEADRYRGRAVIELGVLPGGYGWVFPKGDHFNVGVGGWPSEGPQLRAALVRLCEEHGVASERVEGLRGYRLPLRAPGAPLARGRTLLAGDAAGLIDPISGDGIFEAFLSAEYAADAVSELLDGRATSLEPYEKRLNSRLATHLWASWGVKVALDRFPRATFALARSRIVWSAVERIVRGDVRDVGAVRGVARPPLKALALLARAAGDAGRAYRTPS